MHSDPARLRHELRNVVNSLRLALAVIDRQSDPLTWVEWLEDMEEAAERGSQAIDEFAPFHDPSGPSPAPPG